MRVRPVGVVENPALERAPVPVLAAARRRYPFPPQSLVDAVDACAFRPHHAKDAAHHRHLLLVHLVAVPGGVDAKAVGRPVGRYHLPSRAFLSLPRRLLSTTLARSYLASWSRMPSVSSPSGLSSPRSLRARILVPYSSNSRRSR